MYAYMMYMLYAMYICMHAYIYTCTVYNVMLRCLQIPEDGIGSSEVEVIGGFKPSDTGTGNQTQSFARVATDFKC